MNELVDLEKLKNMYPMFCPKCGRQCDMAEVQASDGYSRYRCNPCRRLYAFSDGVNGLRCIGSKQFEDGQPTKLEILLNKPSFWNDEFES